MLVALSALSNGLGVSQREAAEVPDCGANLDIKGRKVFFLQRLDVIEHSCDLYLDQVVQLALVSEDHVVLGPELVGQ